tara:strand:- start:29103 stop:30188 length:1086 start_codon:yes stop_codon:yes gene_type:complete
MKAIVYNLWVCSMLLLGHLVHGQKVNSKQWETSFRIPKSQRLFLENQYGNILIQGWERNETVVKVKIMVDSGTGVEQQTLLEQVEIREEHLKEGVQISTLIDAVKKGFWDKFISHGNRNSMDMVDLTIDYEVYVPQDLALDIRNKFGDLTIDGWNGELTAAVGHGDIWVNNYLEQARFTLEYGTLKTKDLGQSIVNITNGKMDMDHVEKLELQSQGTEVNIGHVSRMVFTSDKDRVDVGTVGSLKASLIFSIMQIGSLSGAVELSLKLSELKVLQVSHPELQISIDQESSDIHLNVSGTSFAFHSILKEGLLRVPKTFEHVESHVLDPKKRIREIHADYGTPTTGKLSIKGNRGIVILSED